MTEYERELRAPSGDASADDEAPVRHPAAKQVL